MYQEMVRREYVVAVAQSKRASPELKQSLRTNDRVPAFLDNLAMKLAEADLVLASRGKIVKRETIVRLIHDFVDLWLAGLEAHANHRISSDASKSLATEKFEEQFHPEKKLADMGVITDDEAIETPEDEGLH